MSSTDEVVKRKRGRPRITDTVKTDVEEAPKTTKKKATPETEGAEGTPKKAPRQRARQAPIPTLSIASYGKQSAAAQLAMQTEQLRADTAAAAATQLLSPTLDASSGDAIILTLPISDHLENRSSSAKQLTLDARLTAYRPDELLVQTTPSALLSAHSIGGAKFEGSTKVLTVERCILCAALAGPCEECVNTFNQKVSTSLEAYQESRARDEKLTKPDKKLFKNDQIVETPITVEENAELVYNASVIDEGGEQLNDLQGFDNTEAVPFERGQSTTSIRRVSPPPTRSPPSRTITKSVSFAPINKEEFSRECMWHLLPFDSVPVGLPLSFNESTQTFESVGHFCSLECAYAYRLEHRSADAAPIRLLHLAHAMKAKSNGDDIKRKLVPAPPRQALKRFGGSMSYETFLASSEVWYVINRPPFVFVQENVERLDEPSMFRSLSGAGAVNIVQPVTELVRKREKPHPNSVNQWHSSIQRAKANK